MPVSVAPVLAFEEIVQRVNDSHFIFQSEDPSYFIDVFTVGVEDPLFSITESFSDPFLVSLIANWKVVEPVIRSHFASVDSSE